MSVKQKAFDMLIHLNVWSVALTVGVFVWRTPCIVNIVLILTAVLLMSWSHLCRQFELELG